MTLRELKIKTNVVKRIHKEELYYVKEAEEQRKRIGRFVEEGRDEHDIRKQKEVLEETMVMMPDVKKRLAVAYKELQDMVADPQYAETQELADAQSVLDEIVLGGQSD